MKAYYRMKNCGVGQAIKQIDIDEILHMQRICFGYAVDPHIKGARWWIMRKGLNNAGFCSLTTYSDNEAVAFLSLAGVLPKHRGNGLQRHMIKHRVAAARDLKCKRVITYASYDNTISANNLIACGFKLYKPRWDWGLKYSYYFEKKL